MLSLVLPHFLIFHISLVVAVTTNGNWQLLQKSVGIVGMHMQLLHNDRVVIFDRTDFGFSNLTLPGGKCRHDPHETVVKTDCTAHSVDYDVVSNTFRALFIQTNVWCSSGSVMPDGTLAQTGGTLDGGQNVRLFTPCETCDWREINNGLDGERWYATNHLLPDGRQIIVGGRNQTSYEFFPKTTPFYSRAHILPFLIETYEKDAENNLYPFVFLNVDGNLFIFANDRAILFDYRNGKVVRNYPRIPDGNPRSYPSTGSAVLLPIENLEAKNVEAEVLICGGAPRGAFQVIHQGIFSKPLDTCARIKITDPNPNWVMETMPYGRVMNDMVMLPNGNVLIINGAKLGVAGWDYAVNPAFEPFLYETGNPIGSRFEIQTASNIPRMYHSTALLLRDGRVMVAGSNAHQGYVFSNVFFPSELSLEAFSPYYLDHSFANLRPNIREPASQTKLTYAQRFKMRIQVTGKLIGSVSVTMLSPPFNTHSFSMNQRLLVLTSSQPKSIGNSSYEIEVKMPNSPVLAPPTFYILFAVHKHIPSEGIWIKLQ